MEAKAASNEGADETSDGLYEECPVSGAGFEEAGFGKIGVPNPPDAVEQALDQPGACVDPAQGVERVDGLGVPAVR